MSVMPGCYFLFHGSSATRACLRNQHHIIYFFLQITSLPHPGSVGRTCEIMKLFSQPWSVSLFIFFSNMKHACVLFPNSNFNSKTYQAVKDLDFLFPHTGIKESLLPNLFFLKRNESLKPKVTCNSARFNFPGRLYRSHKLVSELPSFHSLLCAKEHTVEEV